MKEQWQELKETIIEMRDNDGIGTQQEVCKFLVNLMNVLEKQMQEPCEDAVSREAVDKLSKALVHTTRDKADFLCNFWEGLQKLPPVTPKQRTGKWIVHKRIHERNDFEYLECDQCGVFFLHGHLVRNSYCPNCGAKMEGDSK